jgi:hypothetical protein
MKGQAVPLGEQQRKEARRKEAVMPKTNQQEELDQGAPRIRQAIIYLSEVCQPGSEGSQFELPINWQRMRCRNTAATLHLEIIGEFVDLWFHDPRSELLRALDIAETRRPNYLIVSSHDRLEGTQDHTFEVAWRLGRSGTVVILGDGDDSRGKVLRHPVEPNLRGRATVSIRATLLAPPLAPPAGMDGFTASGRTPVFLPAIEAIQPKEMEL